VVVLGIGPQKFIVDGFEFVPVIDRISNAFQFALAAMRFARKHSNLRGIVHGQRPDDLVGFHLLAQHVPTLVTLHGAHGLVVLDRRGRVVGSMYRAVERYSLSRTRAILCVSPRTQAYFEANYPHLRDRLHSIPAGIDMDLFRPHDRDGARARFGMSEAARVVLFVGRFEQEKNPLDAMAAYFWVWERHPETRLVMVGNGKLASPLREWAAGTPAPVEILDSVSQEELAWLLSAADVLVVASRNEGLPTVALEALAAGTPVVGTSVGLLPDIVKPGVNGYLVDQISELPFFLERALCETRWATDRCRETVRAFGWDRVAPAVLEVYHEISS